MSTGEQQRRGSYQFGPFRVDPERQLLFRDGEPVPLTPKAFQILLVLLRHGPQVVSKGDLMNAVWPDSFVEEANLSRNIFLLRKALGEGPQDHRYVLTVPGHGYRMTGSVDVVPAAQQRSYGETADLSDSANSLNVIALRQSRIKVRVTEKLRAVWVASGVSAVFVAVSVVAWLLWPRTPELTEKDTVVLADFINTTGDPVFDETMRQGMAVQLEQSPYLGLMSDEQIRRTLKLMGRPADTGLAPELAREICQRNRAAALLEGSIHSLGASYVLGLRAENCSSGKVLDEEQIQANPASPKACAYSSWLRKKKRY
jgi:DNA-binding winged helix-turn-helix (wHTH) protein